MFPIAISPCPNDTFLFYGWIHGLVGQNCPIVAEYADIATLNKWALEKKYPLIKVSLPCFAQIQDDYNLLPVGAALGFGVGPKLIGTSLKKVAIPGKHTTANFLFDLFFKAEEKVFCTYDQIFSLLKEKNVDAGVIIHESRFTFEEKGFSEIADLGKLWEEKFKLPLPLGVIAVRKDVDVLSMTAILQQSYKKALEKNEAMYDFILKLSQENDIKIVQQHIDLYVNEETYQLSELGIKAIVTFLNLYKHDRCTL